MTPVRRTWWLYVDMDAFYAEVERRDHPEWRHRTVIVGGAPAGPSRGVVASATYEARRHGVRAGLPMLYARRLCPDAVFVRPDFERYTRASLQLYEILQRFSPDVIQTSIDEAFVDLTYVHVGRDHPHRIAETLRETIRRDLGLPSTIGLARTRLTAKVAGRCAKPRGFLWVPHGREADFLAPLPVQALPGIGARTRAKLGAMNIWTVGRLQQASPAMLRDAFGGRWWVLPLMARGEDPPRVTPEIPWPQSMGREITLPFSTTDPTVIWGVLHWLIEEVTWRMRRIGLIARSVQVRWRYADLETRGWADRLPWPTAHGTDVYAWIRRRTRRLITFPPPIRLLGVTFFELSPGAPHPLLLQPFRRRTRRARQVQNAVDRIRKRHGFFRIASGDLARWMLNGPSFRPAISPLADWMIRGLDAEEDEPRRRSWARVAFRSAHPRR